MATKSILKTINIEDSKLGHTFAKTLEQIQSVKGKEVIMTRKCTEIKGDMIKKFFD